MANSDNVLRGGLTPKHVDVPELLKHTAFEGIEPNVMKGEAVSASVTNYSCPVPDFGIQKIELSTNESIESNATSLEIWVLIKGQATFECNNTNVVAKKGQAVAILPNDKFSVSAKEDTLMYKAFVPEP
jgi:mannose-6-phosphate isomerase